ncbi:SMR family transporter [Rhodococcus sp. IEGM 1379]|uniref:DMT family transporter n=1 Tax=Rhodococcus sp. IEGM 1379 TaxID=3047086 RepID=UPI0024B76E56|nr:SMR family transporter [Rhodococcus sp. IEGM 1379]MDI9915025.1 SMR family transporter [Rhodococcus sp. IEGM 1379]
MIWLLLVGAIVTEVTATLSLRMVSLPGAKKAWFIPVAIGYLTAFIFLSLALRGGMALGVAYGIWTACGVALTAVASRILFSEPLTKIMCGGLALITVGVLFIELGAAH